MHLFAQLLKTLDVLPCSDSFANQPLPSEEPLDNAAPNRLIILRLIIAPMHARLLLVMHLREFKGHTIL
jgi:hypothetical protein